MKLRQPRTHCRFGHAFTYHNTTIDSRGVICCRRCRAQIAKKYRENNADKVKAYMTEYLKKYREKKKAVGVGIEPILE
jgi:hypothetical protein